jgi:hypothetical protein
MNTLPLINPGFGYLVTMDTADCFNRSPLAWFCYADDAHQWAKANTGYVFKLKVTPCQPAAEPVVTLHTP